MQNVYFPLLAGFIAVAYALIQTFKILKLPRGSQAMIAISDAIAEGAKAYMRRQYKIISLIAILIFVVLWFAFGTNTALAFLVGATFSALAGFTGMNVAVKTNSRVTVAAQKGLGEALSTAFTGGSVTGLMVSGLAL